MTSYSRGDVILVGFIFADGSGVKQRPALVISSDEYHSARHEVIMAAITSNVSRLLTGDHILSRWQETGLRYPSVVTGIIRTVKHAMIRRKLGMMPPEDMQSVDRNLLSILDLRGR